MNRLFNTLRFYLNLVGITLLLTPYHRRPVRCLKLGNQGAAWWVPETVLKPNAVVYSGGVGNDISFELAMIKLHKVEVFAFDPTPAAIAYIKQFRQNRRLHFFPVGLWKENTKLKFFVPQNKTDVSHSVVNLQQTNDYFTASCKTIASLMKQLDHRQIDLLKIDIEGAEYAVLESMLDKNIKPTAICVEFDQPASLIKMRQMVMQLLDQGYMLVKQDYFNFTFYLL
jgi:FkbM family methyltransferase